MRVRAKIVGGVALAIAATGGLLLANAKSKLPRAQPPSFNSTEVAPLFTAFYVRGKPPEKDKDYKDCGDGPECLEITYYVSFKPKGYKGVGDVENPTCPKYVVSGLRNCLDPDPDERESCTAIKRNRHIVFAKGDYPYQVRFSPFGDPIAVRGQNSGAHPVHGKAAVAWYKFTVDSSDPACAKVDAVDPTVIVTN